MGIGTTMKNMLRSDPAPMEEASDSGPPAPERTSSSETRDKLTEQPATSRATSRGKVRKLSSVTPLSAADRYEMLDRNMKLDLERARTHGIAGYGTDAAAASGGTLAGTHAAGARAPGARRASDTGINLARSPTASGSGAGKRASGGSLGTSDQGMGNTQVPSAPAGGTSAHAADPEHESDRAKNVNLGSGAESGTGDGNQGVVEKDARLKPSTQEESKIGEQDLASKKAAAEGTATRDVEQPPTVRSVN